MSNYVDDDTMATSSNYAEELATLQLLPSENPEATEENGEQSMELLRIMHGVTGEECKSNPRCNATAISLGIRSRLLRDLRGHMRRSWAAHDRQAAKQ
ncbi:hypothetical protein V1522DRAFT_401193 [Lipomyces starkeyi]